MRLGIRPAKAAPTAIRNPCGIVRGVTYADARGYSGASINIAFVRALKCPRSGPSFLFGPGLRPSGDRVLRLPLTGSAQASVEVIRFAAADHLCIDLDYRKLDGSTTHPRIEAYSLRRTAEGNIVLHGYDVNKQAQCSYCVDLIRTARVSNQTFVPHYEIELTPRRNKNRLT